MYEVTELNADTIGTDWRADQETRMRVYRMIIRPKIDYGSAVYEAANKTFFGILRSHTK